MAQTNASNAHEQGLIGEPVNRVKRNTKRGVQATRDWFGRRSTMQWILMILVPILLVSAIVGYYAYRSRSSKARTRRTVASARSRRRQAAVAPTRPRRRRAGRQAVRSRGRRTRGRGRTVTPGQATP